MKNKLLLNPGPTNTPDAVKKAQMDWSDVCHRTTEAAAELDELKELLLNRFLGTVESDEFEVAVLAGSGTLGMEAMISSLLRMCWVVVAGKYGERAQEMMSTYNVSAAPIPYTSCEQVPQLPHVSGDLYFVEHETTTGERFDPAEMAEKFPGMRLFIDATSAFGATSYEDVIDRIDGICFCSNKALVSTPGLAVVIYRKDRELLKRTVYANLGAYVDAMPFTIPPGPIAALKAALLQPKPDFDARKAWLIETLQEVGIRCVNDVPSNTVVGFQHPTKSYDELQAFLDEKGIVIYSGVPNIDRSFRVATMSNWWEQHQAAIKEAFHDSCVR